MLQKFLHPQPQDETNKEQNGERFESDTQKIVRRHLEDENHVITEDEIRNVRVGMTPPPDAPTEEAIREREEKIADRKTPDENETAPGEQQATPWDVLEPEE
ncbi:MAG TPA: hypothetical protein VFS22_05175 [Flavisolibacter sp.]|nr:hypothetical protein [Flavisolibacter sp.]